MCRACSVGEVSRDEDGRADYYKGYFNFGPVMVSDSTFSDYIYPEYYLATTTTTTTITETPDPNCLRTGCCKEQRDAWCGILPSGRAAPGCTCSMSWEAWNISAEPPEAYCESDDCAYECLFCRDYQWTCEDEVEPFFCPGAPFATRCSDDVFGARCNHRFWGACWQEHCLGQCGCIATTATTTTTDFNASRVDSMISEALIKEYRVYIVDGKNRRLGDHVATVPTGGDLVSSTCCNPLAYEVEIEAFLPAGYSRFAVVPVTINNVVLPVGATSGKISDRKPFGLILPSKVPLTSLSILLSFREDVYAGEGLFRVNVRSKNMAKVQCEDGMELVSSYAVVPIKSELRGSSEHGIAFPPDCFRNAIGRPLKPLLGTGKGAFVTIAKGEGVHDFDFDSPTLLGPPLLHPPRGVLVREFTEFVLFFSEAVQRGWAPIVVLKRAPASLGALERDENPIVVFDPDVPGKVRVKANGTRGYAGGREYELVWEAGAFKDLAGNYAEGSSELLGPEGYVVRVGMDLQPSGLPFIPYPSWGEAEAVSGFVNLILEFSSLVERGTGDVELCMGSSSSSVCSPRVSIPSSRVLFLGKRVLVNPPARLSPGQQYSLSVPNTLISNFPGLWADGYGVWNYTVTVLRENQADKRPPKLVAALADCNADGDLDDVCDAGAEIYSELDSQVGSGGPIPYTSHVKLYFTEKVTLAPGKTVQLEEVRPDMSVDVVDSNVPVVADTYFDDCNVTMMTRLLRGKSYILNVPAGMITDLAGNPSEGISLSFYVPFTPPIVELAAKDLHDVERSTAIRLVFAGEPRIGMDVEGLMVSIRSLSSQEAQEIAVDDPDRFVFTGKSVLILPDPELSHGQSYSVLLPARSVLGLDIDFGFEFSTRPEDITAPSVILTHPHGVVPKADVDMQAPFILFSEAVGAGVARHVYIKEDGEIKYRFRSDDPLCNGGTMVGKPCMEFDGMNRRLSLYPVGLKAGDSHEPSPWAVAGRHYKVEIEAGAFTDAITAGEALANSMHAAAFSFSVNDDDVGPVLLSSSLESGAIIDLSVTSVMLTFSETVQAGDGSLAITSWAESAESPKLSLLSGVTTISSTGTVVVLTFDAAVKAGEGSLGLYSMSDATVALVEIPVSDISFVGSNLIFSLSSTGTDLVLDQPSYFVRSSSNRAIRSVRDGQELDAPIDTAHQTSTYFKAEDAAMRLVHSTADDFLCMPSVLPDIELYWSEEITNISSVMKTISLHECGNADEGTGCSASPIWSLRAGMDDDADIKVEVLPNRSYQAILRTGSLPLHHRGSSAIPLRFGKLYKLVVEEHLFEDEPVWITTYYPNTTTSTTQTTTRTTSTMTSSSTASKTTSTMTTTTFSAGANLSNTSFYDDEADDNVSTSRHGLRRLSAIDGVSERRLWGEMIEVSNLVMVGSPKLALFLPVCEVVFDQTNGSLVRVYPEFGATKGPRGYQLSAASEAITDPLGNLLSPSFNVSFALEHSPPQFNPESCSPPRGGVASPTENLVLSFSETVQAGRGFIQLWKVEEDRGTGHDSHTSHDSHEINNFNNTSNASELAPAPEISRVSIDIKHLADISRTGGSGQLIAENKIILTPAIWCATSFGCDVLANETATYYLTTSESGVVADLIGNPLADIPDTVEVDPNATFNFVWYFQTQQDPRKAPFVAFLGGQQFDVNTSEVVGFIYFNEMVGVREGMQPVLLEDCGPELFCTESSATIYPPGDESLVNISGFSFDSYGLLRFEATLPHGKRRYRVTVPPFSVQDAGGFDFGPEAEYTYTFEVEAGIPGVVTEMDKPFLGATQPSHGEPHASAARDVILYFNEDVQAGKGSVSFCLNEDAEADGDPPCIPGKLRGGLDAVVPVEDVKVRRNTVSIPNGEGFAYGQTLYLVMPEGAFCDTSMNPSIAMDATNFSFTVQDGDLDPPEVQYVDHGTLASSGIVSLLFSEAVQAAAGPSEGSSGIAVPIFEVDVETGTSMKLEAEGSIAGNTVTLSMAWAAGCTYSLLLSPRAFMDLAGNKGQPIDASFAVSSDTEPPVMVVPFLDDPAMHSVLLLQFNEGVQVGEGMVSLASGSGSEHSVIMQAPAQALPLVSCARDGVRQSSVYVDPGQVLQPGGAYMLTVPSTAFKDAAGNAVGRQWSDGKHVMPFTVNLQRDLKPPRLEFVGLGRGLPEPSFGGDSFTLYFTEAVEVVSSSMLQVRLEPSTGGFFCSSRGLCEVGGTCTQGCNYTAASSAVVLPDSSLLVQGAKIFVQGLPELEAGRGYKLAVDAGKIVDLAGYPLEPVDGDALGFVFQTAAISSDIIGPAINRTSPSDGQRMVPVSSTLQVAFNEDVQAGSGAVELVKVGHDSVPHVHIPIETCIFEAEVMTCQPPEPLDPGATYSVQLDVSAVRDIAGNNAAEGLGEYFGYVLTYVIIDEDQVPPALVSVSSGTTTFAVPLASEEDERTHAQERLLAATKPKGEDSFEPQPKAEGDPKPPVMVAAGAMLALTFSETVQAGEGSFVVLDCSPGRVDACYQADGEMVQDRVADSVDVQADRHRLHFEGHHVFLEIQSLRPGSLYSVRLETPGVFRDLAGLYSAPLGPGVEFRAIPDDVSAPRVMEEVPKSASALAASAEHPVNANITLFFSEAVQVTGPAVVLTAGNKTYTIPTDNSDPAIGTVTVRGSVVDIDPYEEMAYNATVSVQVSPGVFSDRFGNHFEGIRPGDLEFRTVSDDFEQLADSEDWIAERFWPREGSAVQYVNHSLLVFSGKVGESCFADAWESRDRGETWQQVMGIKSTNHFIRAPLAAHAKTATDSRGCLWLLGGECDTGPGGGAGFLWRSCDTGRSWDPLDSITVVPYGVEVPPPFPDTWAGHALAVAGGWQLVIVNAVSSRFGAIWRFLDPEANFVQRVARAPFPFGSRVDPWLLATSDSVLWLLGGHRGVDDEGLRVNLGDVWASYDGGETWVIKTANWVRTPKSLRTPGIPRLASLVVTHDDTIFVLGGLAPNETEQTGVKEAYNSLWGARGLVISPSTPYLLGHRSVDRLGFPTSSPPVVPRAVRFHVAFGEGLQHGAADARLLDCGLLASKSEGLGSGDSCPPAKVGIRAEVDGTSLTVIPEDLLLRGHTYLLEVPPGAVLDRWGNELVGPRGSEYAVSVDADVTAPSVNLAHPSNGSKVVAPWTCIALEASEPVASGTGELLLTAPAGVTVRIPVDQAIIVDSHALFCLPPGKRFTEGQVYTVSAPEGLFRDLSDGRHISTPAVLGSFSMMTSWEPSYDYLDYDWSEEASGLQEELGSEPDIDLPPKLIWVHPQDGATDVPSEIGISVWLFFSGPVLFNMAGNAGEVLFDTDITTVAQFRPNASFFGGEEHLTALPEQNGLKILIPKHWSGKPHVEKGQLFTVTVQKGFVLDMEGRPLEGKQITFRCLGGDRDRVAPKMLMQEPATADGPILGSTGRFDFYFTEPVQKNKGWIRLRSLEKRVRDTWINSQSDDVEVVGPRLSLLLPPGALSAGGPFLLSFPAGSVVDVPRTATDGRSEGGGNKWQGVVLNFEVLNDTKPPMLNLSASFPPDEGLSPTFKLPSSVALVLTFNEPVQMGSGEITLTPRYGSPEVNIPVSTTEVFGSRVLAVPKHELWPGEIYNVSIDEGAFLDMQFNRFMGFTAGYTISVVPGIEFVQLGSGHWANPSQGLTGQRFGHGAAVDFRNNIFVIGGRNGTAGASNTSVLNDVWRLSTKRDINCASSFTESLGCSEKNCTPDGEGGFTLGTTTLPRVVWQRRSLGGASCVDPDGVLRSRMQDMVTERVDVCPCPICTKPPGPESGVPLPNLIKNEEYVKAYVKVTAANGKRELLCQEGRIPSGPFVCNVNTHYFGFWSTPYPNCDEPTGCSFPPDYSFMGFVSFDPEGSSDGRDCTDITLENPLRHGRHCAFKCGPGLQANASFLCEVGEYSTVECARQSCGDGTIDNGHVTCDTPIPLMNSQCSVHCDDGYTATLLETNCTTSELEAEAPPKFTPMPRCIPSMCGNFTYSEGAILTYSSPYPALGDTAKAVCEDGYEPVRPGYMDLKCGIKTQEIGTGNAEWQLSRTEERAGLLCTPVGVKVEMTVVLDGSFILDLFPPPGASMQELCEGTRWEEMSFSLTVSLSLAFAAIASSAAITASDVLSVALAFCSETDNSASGAGADDDEGAVEGDLGRRLGVGEEVSYRVRVGEVSAALALKASLEEADVSDRFASTFAVALSQSAGVTISNIRASPIIVSMLYTAMLPTTTVPIPKSTTTPAPPENKSAVDEGPKDLGAILAAGDVGALPIGVIIGVSVGLGCCCCTCLLACIFLRRRCSRRRYKTQISAQEDESEASGDERPALALTQGDALAEARRRQQLQQALGNCGVYMLENDPS